MPEIDRPSMADYYEDHEGPDEPQESWRDAIDWRRVALLAGAVVYFMVMYSLPQKNVLETIFLWVMVVLILAIFFLAGLYFPAKWAIRFVLKR